MTSQTTSQPEGKKQPARSAQTSRRYTRQTASHVEAKRDGQPLIFKYGGHLTKAQKTQIQRLSIWAFIGLIILCVIAVFAGFWINFNIVTPNLPIANVNGQNIPQSDYRKMVALQGQLEANKIKGKNGLRALMEDAKTKSDNAQKAVTDANTKVDNLNKQIKALPANSSQRSSLEQQLTDAQKQQTDAVNTQKPLLDTYNTLNQQDQLEESLFTQSQMGTQSVQWLQEDLVITNWLNSQSSAIQNKINPTSSQITKAMNDLKNNLPSGTTYQSFLSTSNVSDSDIQAMQTVALRRANMQSYLASQVNSPARQVEIRGMTIPTQKAANDILKQLKGGADFATLAKQKSQDNNTKNNGGEIGWRAPGQYMLNEASNLSAVVDQWISDPSRKVNDLSPVLSENGTFHIIQIEAIDPARGIGDADLTKLRNNALGYWIALKKASGTKFSDPDSNKLFDPSNMPSWIPSSPPSSGTPTATSAGGTVPGGTVPGGSTGTGTGTGQ